MEPLSTIVMGLFLLSAMIAILWMMFHDRQFLADSVVKELKENNRRQRDALKRLDNAAKWKMALAQGISIPLAISLTKIVTNRSSMEVPNWSDVGRYFLAGLAGYGACVLILRALLGKGGKAKSRSDSEA